MAIPNDKVKKMQELTTDLGELIKELNPVMDKEWDAFAKLVDAHKNMMKIDTDSLLQLPLPLEDMRPKKGKPRKDCPRCHGAGEWADPADSTGSVRPCDCSDVEKKAWPAVKKDWAALLEPLPVG